MGAGSNGTSNDIRIDLKLEKHLSLWKKINKKRKTLMQE